MPRAVRLCLFALFLWADFWWTLSFFAVFLVFGSFVRFIVVSGWRNRWAQSNGYVIMSTKWEWWRESEVIKVTLKDAAGDERQAKVTFKRSWGWAPIVEVDWTG